MKWCILDLRLYTQYTLIGPADCLGNSSFFLSIPFHPHIVKPSDYGFQITNSSSTRVFKLRNVTQASFFKVTSLDLSKKFSLLGKTIHSTLFDLQIRCFLSKIESRNFCLTLKIDWCDPGVRRYQLKLVEVVTVADVDAVDRVGDSFCRFGLWRLLLKLHFCSDFKPKG